MKDAPTASFLFLKPVFAPNEAIKLESTNIKLKFYIILIFDFFFVNWSQMGNNPHFWSLFFGMQPVFLSQIAF